MRNLLLTIAYCGKNLHGWQIQDNALTVQEVFQDALFQIIHEHPDIKGCSRTDSGVHANMYCVSMRIEHPITNDHLMMAMNRYLPDDVAVTAVRDVPDDFHARYSCSGKEYIYKVWNSRVRNPFLQDMALHYRYQMNIEALHREAQALSERMISPRSVRWINAKKGILRVPSSISTLSVSAISLPSR